MVSVSQDIIALTQHLLLGFLAAWISYGLTARPKPSPFERVVEALLYTAIIRAVMIPLSWILLWCGRHIVSLGTWNAEAEFFSSAVFAILLGHILAFGINSNIYHDALQKLKITSRTARPSQWFSAFHGRQRYVTLHLKDGRRLQGWPTEWPDEPESGHFLIEEPAWILDDNKVLPIHTDELIVVAGNDVEMVEFLRSNTEIEGLEEEIERVTSVLVQESEQNEQADG